VLQNLFYSNNKHPLWSAVISSLVALSLIAWAAQRLEVFYIKSQLWKELAWLDVVYVDGKTARVISAAT
jgi:hypothetical protein